MDKTLAKVRVHVTTATGMEYNRIPWISDSADRTVLRAEHILHCSWPTNPKPGRLPHGTGLLAHCQEQIEVTNTKYITDVTNYFTQWIEAIIRDEEKATVARVPVNEWISQYEAPNTIRSNQSKNFDSWVFMESRQLCEFTRPQPFCTIHNLMGS